METKQSEKFQVDGTGRKQKDAQIESKLGCEIEKARIAPIIDCSEVPLTSRLSAQERYVETRSFILKWISNTANEARKAEVFNCPLTAQDHIGCHLWTSGRLS
jgi:hypothetical protein